VVACLLHVLVHALDIAVGEWHDYAVYALVGVSFFTTVIYARQQGTPEPLAA
jgi:hypothetical protein